MFCILSLSYYLIRFFNWLYIKEMKRILLCYRLSFVYILSFCVDDWIIVNYYILLCNEWSADKNLTWDRNLSRNHESRDFFKWSSRARLYSKLLDYLSDSLSESEWNVSPRHSRSLSSYNHDAWFVLLSLYSECYKRCCYISIHFAFPPYSRKS